MDVEQTHDQRCMYDERRSANISPAPIHRLANSTRITSQPLEKAIFGHSPLSLLILGVKPWGDSVAPGRGRLGGVLPPGKRVFYCCRDAQRLVMKRIRRWSRWLVERSR